MVVALATKRRTVVNLFRYLATGVLVVAALVAARYGWLVYVTSPWTRDGMVRVQVANVAPQISGQIVEVRASDNQHVRKGDILYVIEKFDFEVALENAKATILSREADLSVKKAQNARRAILTTLSTSIEEKQIFDGSAKMADAALLSAKAALAQADINLQRTEVRSPVDGYVTNLLMRVGDSARAGTPNVSVIDEHSYWIDAYFEETKIANIHVGDDVEATLLGYQTPVKGRIESITGGISAANAASSTQGLPNVDPVFTWVRLAQRIPVRIRIDQVPQNVPLVAGMTCSVSVVGGKQAPAPKQERGILDRLISRLG
ncbi:HlyD family secretion protein [Bradyrhizobium sp. JYMT SZCCT0428]|uniref:HlyD family efflux transporter periplasmic adaptor subunit n=1 Tax=Bradyrhizobium sp. JYMT SZCCT0428 TaxID=2807673 RepID=UPI001BA6E775|nr:HlyD family secretion protein [Bradyrhizobium sp. JYMT SZCCT0428]MBR1153985.1 HlyD family secretion protein [Bradyrhizobium sp. JYMT SZCCT0428]